MTMLGREGPAGPEILLICDVCKISLRANTHAFAGVWTAALSLGWTGATAFTGPHRCPQCTEETAEPKTLTTYLRLSPPTGPELN